MQLKTLEISMVLEDPRRCHENACVLMRAFQPAFTVVSQDSENADQPKNAINPGNSSRVDAFSINPNKKVVFFRTKNKNETPGVDALSDLKIAFSSRVQCSYQADLATKHDGVGETLINIGRERCSHRKKWERTVYFARF